MKHSRWAVFLLSFMVVVGSFKYKMIHARAAEPAQAQPAAAPAAKPTVEDFGWVTGRWTGLAGTNPTEQVCSEPSNGLILCMFHEVNEKPQSIELATLRETGDGIEERVRNFTPELETWEGAAPITLKLQSYTPTESIFINVNAQSPVKRVFLEHPNRDEMSTRVEIVDKQGKVIFIGAKSQRVK